MLKKIITTLTGEDASDLSEARRKHSRVGNENDNMTTVCVGSYEYSVRDWSKGGVFFTAVNNDLKINDTIEFTLKFALPNGMIDVPHSGKIVRKTFDGYGLQFTPLTRETREKFARVMDGVISRGFGQSSIATYH